MNNERDLEIARLLGWYRIPLKSAPKVVQVDYLAFYQTSAFADKRWCIEWIAPVRGHELLSRAELIGDQPDHPRARDLYYKIQLGPLEQLPAAIPAAKWRRLTFLYTTGEYLLQARNINDLVVQSEERKTLWQALRERQSTSGLYNEPDLPDFDLDPLLINMLLGLDGFSDPLQNS
jgi:hypothetical protein